MNKNIIRAVVVTAFLVLIIIIVALYAIGTKPRPAGLLVIANIPASVYVDGQLGGKTPYEATFLKNNVNIRVVPDDLTVGKEYEVSVPLSQGLKSVVKKEFNLDENLESSYLVFFEKKEAKNPSLGVETIPDGSQIYIDGTPRGFAPYILDLVSQGEHQLTIKNTGYNDMEILVKTLPDYNLRVVAKLSKIADVLSASDISNQNAVYIAILDTPTGYLRVRAEPDSSAIEIHQVNPGEKYLLLEESSDMKWYKIQLQEPAPGLPDGISGWVSAEYSQKELNATD